MGATRRCFSVGGSATSVPVPGYGRLTDAIWANGIDVYHMFTWSGDGSRLDQWVTYAQEEGCDLLTPTDALVFGQFYISQMAASYDAGGKSVSYAALMSP